MNIRFANGLKVSAAEPEAEEEEEEQPKDDEEDDDEDGETNRSKSNRFNEDMKNGELFSLA